MLGSSKVQVGVVYCKVVIMLSEEDEGERWHIPLLNRRA
jgi:hypothetical protein